MTKETADESVDNDSLEKKRNEVVYVDVIVPVHNAADTVVATVESALHQTVPRHLEAFFRHTLVDVAVCCYDDGSTDQSWALMSECQKSHDIKQNQPESGNSSVQARLLLAKSPDGVARGAGFARNRAATLRQCNSEEAERDASFLCLLDSDDFMHETRVAEQVHAMLSLDIEQRHRTILGCQFVRDPPDATWHYAKWANNLSDERLMLERFREVTVLQPTWMLTKSRYWSLGGYIEAPHPQHESNDDTSTAGNSSVVTEDGRLRMVHPTYDTPDTLRLAEDLRFFHSHLHANGSLRLHRTATPLLTYRHRAGMSQSCKTPRKLLVHLRVLAFEATILSVWKSSFVVWGAGRDGKDFVKALSEQNRRRIACMVDVDEKKINAGYYINGEIRIPIVHFSLLAADPNVRQQLKQAWEEGRIHETSAFGRIHKSRPVMSNGPLVETDGTVERPRKQRRVIHEDVDDDVDVDVLPSLPVVVCVAMYRTNGALEANVKSIGRTEGKSLWHFC